MMFLNGISTRRPLVVLMLAFMGSASLSKLIVGKSVGVSKLLPSPSGFSSALLS